jgi:hypothetical protein
MPHPAVDAAFKSRLATYWTATPFIGVGGATMPPNGESFGVLQYPVVAGEQPTLGRRFFENGVARFVLNVERPLAVDEGYVWAAELAALFRCKKLGGGLETFTPDGPIINDASDNGNYIELAVLVPYRYQFNDPDSPP